MISIITACYNSAKTIRKTFECMLTQTYQDFEYIVVDGGSTDGTINIIEEYVPKFKGKMSYKSEKDNGIYDAMNKGIARCRGDLIGIINSDDWYETDTLEKVAGAYYSINEKYAVIYGMQRTYREGKECSILFYHHQFLSSQMIAHPTCFVTRATYENFGVFAASQYRSSADYELMLRYANSNEIKFIPVYSILANFAFGGISSSHIGVIETAKLKYSLGLINRKKYMITIAKNKLRVFLAKHWNI